MLSLKNFIFLISILFLFSVTSVSIAYSQEDVDFLFQKGLESYENNNVDEAISYFEKVLEIDPNHVDALSNRGGLLSTIGKHDEALSDLNKAIEIEPNHVRALINKGILLAFLNQTDSAIFSLDKALEIEPDNIEALRNRAVYFVFQENYADAVTEFYKILEIEPDDPIISKYLGMAKERLGYLKTKGFVEFILRDDQGRLVTYFKTSQVLVLNHRLGQDYLDKVSVTEEISVNGTHYEVRQELYHTVYDTNDLYSMTNIGYKSNPNLMLVLSPSWGFPINKGDTVDTLVTFFIQAE